MHSGYKTLGIMITINAVIMFLLNYSMIDQLQHFRFNINAVYMALMMVAPMVILMLLFMRSMFQNKRLNTFLFLAFGVLFILTFSLTRTQGLVGDGQFLRSMIPSPFGRDFDVPGGGDQRPGNFGALRTDYQLSARGDCPDGGNPRTKSLTGGGWSCVFPPWLIGLRGKPGREGVLTL